MAFTKTATTTHHHNEGRLRTHSHLVIGAPEGVCPGARCRGRTRPRPQRLWGCFLARENARLKIARLEHVSGANNRTHAARGPSRAQRARDDANFFLFHQHGARSSPSSWRGG